MEKKYIKNHVHAKKRTGMNGKVDKNEGQRVKASLPMHCFLSVRRILAHPNKLDTLLRTVAVGDMADSDAFRWL